MTKNPVASADRADGTAIEKAKLMLLKYPNANSADISRLAVCSLRSVYRARKELVDVGLLKKNPHHRTPQKLDEKVAIESLEVQEVVEEQQAGRLTIEESLDRYTRFARMGEDTGNLTLAKDATREFHKLEAQTTESALGPPDPVTDRDKIDRTTAILDVIGPILVASAIVQAFSLLEDRTQFEEEFARQSVTHPPRNEQRAELSGISSSPIDEKKILLGKKEDATIFYPESEKDEPTTPR